MAEIIATGFVTGMVPVMAYMLGTDKSEVQTEEVRRREDIRRAVLGLNKKGAGFSTVLVEKDECFSLREVGNSVTAAMRTSQVYVSQSMASLMRPTPVSHHASQDPSRHLAVGETTQRLNPRAHSSPPWFSSILQSNSTGLATGADQWSAKPTSTSKSEQFLLQENRVLRAQVQLLKQDLHHSQVSAAPRSGSAGRPPSSRAKEDLVAGYGLSRDMLADAGNRFQSGGQASSTDTTSEECMPRDRLAHARFPLLLLLRIPKSYARAGGRWAGDGPLQNWMARPCERSRGVECGG